MTPMGCHPTKTHRGVLLGVCDLTYAVLCTVEKSVRNACGFEPGTRAPDSSDIYFGRGVVSLRLPSDIPRGTGKRCYFDL